VFGAVTLLGAWGVFSIAILLLGIAKHNLFIMENLARLKKESGIYINLPVDKAQYLLEGNFIGRRP